MESPCEERASGFDDVAVVFALVLVGFGLICWNLIVVMFLYCERL